MIRRHSRKNQNHSLCPFKSHSAETPHLNFHVHHFDTSRDTSRLIVQLQETELRFDQFYDEHTRELRQCLEMRRFEVDFRELQVCLMDFC